MSTVDRLASALSTRYRVDRELGAGGMATVYLAQDLKHERDVAIKVLHPDLGAALGADRFLAEIKTTAKLQHPHILPLLDSGAADGLLYYVMPFVRGETLRARLEREKVLPVAEAVRIAREIASALDYAHRQQVIHRDIKPENILLHDGSALVADFGIALAVQQAGGARMTQTGLSLGTPQYMSPEQAMGERSIDARSDLYALGAMCYEMLTGDAPFTGNTVQAIVAKVMTEKPVSLRTVRDTVPVHVEQAVLACLAKLPADRPATAKEFSDALAESGASRAGTFAPENRAASRSARATRIPLLLGAAGLLAVGAFVDSRFLQRDPDDTSSSSATFVSLVPQAGETWELNGGANMALSPEGRRVVLVGRSGDRAGLLLRSLDSLGSRVLPGTEGATGAFWSPNGRSIGFFAGDQLKVLELATGTTRALCRASGVNGTWGANDVIIYQAGSGLGLHRTSAQGGACESIASRLPQEAIPARPSFFADGEHLLVSAAYTTWLTTASLDSVSVLTQTDRSSAVAAGARHIAYNAIGSQGPLLEEVDLAARKLSGRPVRLSPVVNNPGGDLGISVSTNGALVLDEGRGTSTKYILRVSAGGVVLDSIPTKPDAFGIARFSADGKRLASAGWSIDVNDLAQGTWSELVPFIATSPQTLWNVAWSPADSAIAYGAGRQGKKSGELRIVQLRDGTVRTVYRDTTGRLNNLVLTDWSRDGRYLVFNTPSGRHGPFREVRTLDLQSGAVRDEAWGDGNAQQATVSPDGKWLAWAQTSADNQTAIFVRAFGGSALPVRVSPRAGRFPRWHPRTGELLYTTSDQDIVAVRLSGTGAPLGMPRTVVPRTVLGNRDPTTYDVSPSDGSLIVAVGEPRRRPLTLVLDWPALLRTPAAAR